MSKAALMDAAETVIDAGIDVAQEAVETVDTLERIPTLALNGTTRKQQVIILTAVAAASATVSGVVTAFATKKRVQAQYEQILADQLAAAERHYTVLGDRPSLESVAAKVDEVEGQTPVSNEASAFAANIAQYQGAQAPTVVEDADGTIRHTAIQNVWETEGSVGNWNQEQEESKRAANPGRPHVISRAEYDAQELDYTMDELTYFGGDDTLAEPDGTAVATHLVDATVGEGNLLRFGHGSGDPNTVFIRNPRTEMDYEVTRDPGLFAQAAAEAAGFAQKEVQIDEEMQAALRNRRR